MSNIYRSFITNRFKTNNLLNFRNSVGDADDQTTIYISFGRREPWADNENDVNFAPPYPSETPEGYLDVWNRLIGASKIKKDDLDAVIARKDWGDIRVDDPFRFYIGDIICTNTIANVNTTESGEGIIVYRCVDVPDEGECSITEITDKNECMKLGGTWNAQQSAGTNANIPRGQGDAIDTGDGYKWEYLYTIPPDVTINRVTQEYIVVPFPDEENNNPDDWRLNNVIQWNNERTDLIYRTKCSTLRFKAYLDSIDFPEFSKPGNTGFRQLNIIINPLEKKVESNDVDVKATNDIYLNDELEHSSGEIIYMENRRPIIRSFDQVEEINIIFQF